MQVTSWLHQHHLPLGDVNLNQLHINKSLHLTLSPIASYAALAQHSVDYISSPTDLVCQNVRECLNYSTPAHVQSTTAIVEADIQSAARDIQLSSESSLLQLHDRVIAGKTEHAACLSQLYNSTDPLHDETMLLNNPQISDVNFTPRTSALQANLHTSANIFSGEHTSGRKITDAGNFVCSPDKMNEDKSAVVAYLQLVKDPMARSLLQQV